MSRRSEATTNLDSNLKASGLGSGQGVHVDANSAQRGVICFTGDR